VITSKLTSKAQTTIPQPIRAALRLREGDELVYEIQGDGSSSPRRSRSGRRRPVQDVQRVDSAADRKAYAVFEQGDSSRSRSRTRIDRRGSRARAGRFDRIAGGRPQARVGRDDHQRGEPWLVGRRSRHRSPACGPPGSLSDTHGESRDHRRGRCDDARQGICSIAPQGARGDRRELACGLKPLAAAAGTPVYTWPSLSVSALKDSRSL